MHTLDPHTLAVCNWRGGKGSQGVSRLQEATSSRIIDVIRVNTCRTRRVFETQCRAASRIGARAYVSARTSAHRRRIGRMDVVWAECKSLTAVLRIWTRMLSINHIGNTLASAQLSEPPAPPSLLRLPIAIIAISFPPLGLVQPSQRPPSDHAHARAGRCTTRVYIHEPWAAYGFARTGRGCAWSSA